VTPTGAFKLRGAGNISPDLLARVLAGPDESYTE